MYLSCTFQRSVLEGSSYELLTNIAVEPSGGMFFSSGSQISMILVPIIIITNKTNG